MRGGEDVRSEISESSRLFRRLVAEEVARVTREDHTPQQGQDRLAASMHRYHKGDESETSVKEDLRKINRALASWLAFLLRSLLWAWWAVLLSCLGWQLWEIVSR